MREAYEREKQFVQLIRHSPEILQMLDIEDSMLEDPPKPSLPQEQTVVSSKQVAITKLDLKKVEEI